MRSRPQRVHKVSLHRRAAPALAEEYSHRDLRNASRSKDEAHEDLDQETRAGNIVPDKCEEEQDRRHTKVTVPTMLLLTEKLREIEEITDERCKASHAERGERVEERGNEREADAAKRPGALVERFDIEPFPDFSAK